MNLTVDGVTATIASNNKAISKILYGTARGLTRTAKDAQVVMKTRVAQLFTLRTTWWDKGPWAIKVDMATKTSLMARLSTAAVWMQLHETGGIKQMQGKDLIIPILYKPSTSPNVVFGAKRSKRDLILKSQLPRNLGAKIFEIPSHSGPLLARVLGKGKNRKLNIMYALEKSSKIKPRLDFVQTSLAVARNNIHQNITEEIQKALAS